MKTVVATVWKTETIAQAVENMPTEKTHFEKALDHALIESFPASDPIATNLPSEDETPSPEKLHLESVLDEALLESFPASDPIAVTVTKASKIEVEVKVGAKGKHRPH